MVPFKRGASVPKKARGSSHPVKGRSTNIKSTKSATKKDSTKEGGGGHQDLADQMEGCVWEMHQTGFGTVPESYVLQELGYGHPASRGYRDAIRICLKERQTLVRMGGTAASSGSGGKKPSTSTPSLELTELGIAQMRANAVGNDDDDDDDDDDDSQIVGDVHKGKGAKSKMAAVKGMKARKQKCNEDHIEKLKDIIAKRSNKKAPPRAVDAMFALFLDGSAHDHAKMLEVTGYKRRDSSGFKVIWKVFGELDLLRKGPDGLYSLAAEKVFPFGRP